MVLTGGAAQATGTDGAAVMRTAADSNFIGSTQAETAVMPSQAVTDAVDIKIDRVREARIKGYEGEACGECGNFTLVRNGTCMKCNTCGATSGCS